MKALWSSDEIAPKQRKLTGSLFWDTYKNLWVWIWQQAQLWKTDSVASFFELRLLAKVEPFLSRNDLEKSIHAFISSRLNYCNTLWVGLAKSSFPCLQLVQNVAARILTGTFRREHIIPVLLSLHWLPVYFRIYFKHVCFKCYYWPGFLLLVRNSNLLLAPIVPLFFRSTSLLQISRLKLKQWAINLLCLLWNSVTSGICPITDFCLFISSL